MSSYAGVAGDVQGPELEAGSPTPVQTGCAARVQGGVEGGCSLNGRRKKRANHDCRRGPRPHAPACVGVDIRLLVSGPPGVGKSQDTRYTPIQVPAIQP